MKTRLLHWRALGEREHFEGWVVFAALLVEPFLRISHPDYRDGLREASKQSSVRARL